MLFISECNPPFSMLPTGCYYYSTRRVSWLDARDDCISYGADLAIITSDQEQDVLQDYLEDVADPGKTKNPRLSQDKGPHLSITGLLLGLLDNAYFKSFNAL